MKKIIPVILVCLLLFNSINLYAADESYGHEVGYANFIISDSRTISYKFLYKNNYEDYLPILLLGNNGSAGGTLIVKNNGKWIKSGYSNVYYSITDFGNERVNSITSSTSRINLNANSFISFESNLYTIHVNDLLLYGNSWGSNYINNFIDYLNGDAELNSNIELPEPPQPDEYDGTNGEYGLSDDAPEDIKLALDGWQLIGQSMYNMDNRHAQFSLKLDGLNDLVDKVDVFISKHGNVAEAIWLSALHVLAFIPEPYQPLFASLVIAADTETAIMHAVTNDNDNTEDINITLPEPYVPGDEYDINIRPVITDPNNGKHYYGNWKTYTTIGDTIINNYQSTTINNVTYETSAQSQKQFEFNYQPPAAGGFVNNYPPVTNETNTTVNNIYNYYTIYNSENNNIDNSITNNYWSYPSTLDTNTPEVDELLTELTPENFFTFLKKFLDSLLKFFTMIINFLQLFIPAWVIVILKIAVTSALLLAIGLIIVKGVL